MTDLPNDRARPRQGGDPDLPLPELIAVIREEAERQGLGLSNVARGAGLGDLLVRVETGEAREGELSVGDVTALGSVLGVSASELIARAEALAREERER